MSVSYVTFSELKASLISHITHRDVEYNPNKPSVVVSCGDDRLIKFWDVRNLASPLKTLSGHSHFVWCTRFNPFHDQLLLRSVSESLTCPISQIALYEASI
jgi:WD40 repeat protein